MSTDLERLAADYGDPLRLEASRARRRAAAAARRYRRRRRVKNAAAALVGFALAVYAALQVVGGAAWPH